MDELELLKKDWQKQEVGLPKLSYNELYKMILRRSSSIVKWIFIISILEFALWASIDIAARLTGKYEDMEVAGMGGFTIISSAISYGVLIYFIIRFYLNYKKIKTTDSAKVLMQNILKTRKTVKYYVWINLTLIGALMITTMIYLTFNKEFLELHEHSNVTPVIYILTGVVLSLIIVAILGFVYYLIYGLLTRKLKRNYKELKKMEI
ncbi:hypothetical protein GCM10022393_42990 [Aquimarina addita]|uniref:DUF3278 domain-containing protein n=1 Tax=Aquimarina addita TaxID=870485 RepID=A0ABP6UXD8_9FLAO